MNTCGTCVWCWQDDRVTDYRRDPCWFCRKKGPFFSRNVRIGEQNRIHPQMPACADYQTMEEKEECS